MKTKKTISFYASLLKNLLLIVLLITGTTTLVLTGGEQNVKELSKILLNQVLEQTKQKLDTFFAPALGTLGYLEDWTTSGFIQIEKTEELTKVFRPIIKENPQFYSLIFADERGREFIMFHHNQTWFTREMKRDVSGNQSLWKEENKKTKEIKTYQKDIDYDPRHRPWYQGAKQSKQTSKGNSYFWTDPYIFYTSKELGMTCSKKIVSPEGIESVLGVDILLSSITDFTSGTKLAISPNSKIFVFTQEGKFVGLPKDSQFQTKEAQRAAFLKTPEEVQFGLMEDFQKLNQNKKNWEPIRFKSEGKSWWGLSKPFSLSQQHSLQMVVLVPEEEILLDIRQKQIWLIAFTLIVLIFTVLQATLLARRYSHPLEMLVQNSRKMGKGDLDTPVETPSSIREVHRLTIALEQLRLSLKTLIKMEGDLEVAEQIQQNTFPRELPETKHFEFTGWSKPAEQTGGDTYDVFGLSHTQKEKNWVLTNENPEKVFFLLADAAGHGVGPALLATEVHAMMRIGMRMESDLLQIICAMNEQLSSEIVEGRFITGWLGELDVKNHTLLSYSVGQAPLLHFHAATQECSVFDADTFPFGMMDDLGLERKQPFLLEPGDLFCVISDGIYEAMNPSEEMFGKERVIEIIKKYQKASVEEILKQLREAVVVFCAHYSPHHADDDQTVILIKRREAEG